MQNEAQKIIKILPNKPGVYQFINTAREVIYVGKAKDLKKRVSSYFSKQKHESAKVKVLVSKIVDIKYIVVDSENDALLLENNLIKKLKPRYNILLKDDKTYPWICIKNEPFPRVFSTRRIVQDGSRYFGPYTSGVILKSILNLIKSIYPLRTCNLNLSPDQIKKGKYKPCLEYQIGNCLAPCIGNQTKEDYDANIESIVQILKGNIQDVKRIIKSQMQNLSNEYMFEEAQKFKEKLDALERFQAKSTIVSATHRNLDIFSMISFNNTYYVNYLKVLKGAVVQSHNVEVKRRLDETESEILGMVIPEIRQRVGGSAQEIIVPFRPDFFLEGNKYTVPTRGDKKKLLDLSLRNARSFAHERHLQMEKQNPVNRTNRILEALKNDFKTEQLPRHIECFDNSNLQGTNPVASCVVFRNAKPSKKEYRLFNIKTVEGPDDYASMTEVVGRRYKRMIENDESLPQLVVIDGGKGQLSAAYTAIKHLSIQHIVQVIGIAKRLEEIFFPNDAVPLYLNKNSESLKIIQHARNEAHRFAIAHHRNRRSKGLTSSVLTSIDGVGEKTALALFKKFKSLDSISNAEIEELTKLVGAKKAHIIKESLNKKP